LGPPLVIEIHPSFDEYCPSIEHFLDVYEAFEKRILEAYPSTSVFIENRAGTRTVAASF
jgi:hypothetical protein